jgi:hypothetical protein
VNVESDFATIFAGLARPSADGDARRFTARSVSTLPAYRVGKSTADMPALLIAVDRAPGQPRPPTVKLANVSVQYDLRCRVEDPDGDTKEESLTVVEFLGHDRDLAQYFLRVIESLVRALGPKPSEKEIASLLRDIVELFRALERIPRKTVQGLWAELFLIARAGDPCALAAAWHTTTTDRFDFGAGEQRIEVKSADSRQRSHHFSQDQLRPPAPVRALVCSILLERTGSGASLGGLIEEVRRVVASQPLLVAKVELIVVDSLGLTLSDALEWAFDRRLAEASLQFFEAGQLPAIDTAISDRISQVQFVLDLSDAVALTEGELAKLTGLFLAARPRG